MPKGRHKGKSKHYITEEEIRAQAEKEKREESWRKQIDSDDDSDNDAEDKKDKKKGNESDGDYEDSSSEGDIDDELEKEFGKGRKSKGVEGVIEVTNPNRAPKKTTKVTDLDVNKKVELSRREREEIEKQRAQALYRKKHEAGETDEARRDLARLAVIRKQREEAAVKRRQEELLKPTKDKEQDSK